MNASFAKISHNLIVITPCEFIELSEENYHLMWKSVFTRGEVTQNSYNEGKKNCEC